MGSMFALLRPDIRVVTKRTDEGTGLSGPTPQHSVTLTPIGVVHSSLLERADAPRQPRIAGTAQGTVELFAGRGYEDALLDVDQWDHIWLVFLFHHNVDYRPKVQPPRSAVKRGVLSTRSPYRPNPIGLSAVRLLRVEGLTLHVGGLDLLDGTPVLDVKPYVPYADCIPEANHGWLDVGEVEAGVRPADPVAAYQVHYAPLAEEQLAFLGAHGSELRARIDAALALGPSPHAYRRIKQTDTGFVLAIKDWRVHFESSGRVLTVQRLKTGYRPSALFGDEPSTPELHRLFVAKWPAAL
jgi:tRNA-Thr(GGU) m(6)t(6)A37 methyltransferase TsaA